MSINTGFLASKIAGMKDSNTLSTEAKIAKYKEDAQVSASSPLLTVVAGCESTGGNTLLADFIFFAQKLEKLVSHTVRAELRLLSFLEVQNVQTLGSRHD